MGREAKCDCLWNDKAATVTTLLRSDMLTLRGALKATFPRSALS